MEELKRREHQLSTEMAQVQAQYDTTFQDLVKMQQQNEELSIELEKRKQIEEQKSIGVRPHVSGIQKVLRF